MTQTDPLPHQFLIDDDAPELGGSIKVRAEDFLVDELPLYEPCGEGEHLYIRVQKTGVAHAELVSCVRRAFGVTTREIGYAGMKDKRGVTQQTISVHLPNDHSVPKNIDLGHERLQVLWADRHTNKLRLGHLRGNRFAIRIRDVDPAKIVTVRNRLDKLESLGVPNFFGGQRFGYRRNNHIVGQAIAVGAWERAARELLGITDTPFPDVHRERREDFEAGRFDKARRQWGPADRNELIVIRHLADGASFETAIRRMGRNPLRFLINAFQSAVFNHVLDARLESKTIDSLLLGDLAWVHSKNAVFLVDEHELATNHLDERVKRIDLSPSGPLWGTGMTATTDAVHDQECASLSSFGLDPETLLEGPMAPEGGRRPMRVHVTDRAVESGVDEHGPYIRVAFDLQRGAYATVVLRELTRTRDPDQLR